MLHLPAQPMSRIMQCQIPGAVVTCAHAVLQHSMQVQDSKLPSHLLIVNPISHDDRQTAPASMKADARIRKLVPAQEMNLRRLYAGC